jgi:hypothetical protein
MDLAAALAREQGRPIAVRIDLVLAASRERGW